MTLLINMLPFILTIFMVVSITYLVAQFKQNNSIMDVVYGPTFFIAMATTMYLTEYSTRISILILIVTGLWATRLSIRIGRKNYSKPEDARYAAWRTKWNRVSHDYFLRRSYFQIYLLQGSVIAIVGLPFVLAQTAPDAVPSLITIAGLIVSLFGLSYETIADWQLDRYLKRKQQGLTTAPTMQTGLFHFSRRPNYFGELLIWWGFALMVLPFTPWYLALLSPLLITHIISRVTGPMLEKIFLEKYPTEYGEYMKTTSYIIPWKPKK